MKAFSYEIVKLGATCLADVIYNLCEVLDFQCENVLKLVSTSINAFWPNSILSWKFRFNLFKVN